MTVGLHRSGTSLLYALLNQHPAIALMYEADVLSFGQTGRYGTFRRDGLRRAEFWNQALSRHRMGEEATASVRNARGFYRAFAERKHAEIWGEKSPAYCTCLPRIARVFPEARFIVLLRDVTDVYRSILEAGLEDRFFRRAGMLPRLLYSYRRLLRDARLLERAGQPVAWIEYEELVRNPEGVGRQVCSFLGIPYHPAMATLCGADLSAVWDAPHHRRLREGIISLRADPDENLVSARAREIIAELPTARVLREEASPSLPAPLSIRCQMWTALGAALVYGTSMKRICYRWVPWELLRFYRFIEGPAEHQGTVRYPAFQVARPTLPEVISRWKQNPARRTIGLLCFAALSPLAVVDYLTGPAVTLGPFYLLPVAIVTLILGRPIGVVMSAFAALAWTIANLPEVLRDVSQIAILIGWNSTMRFILLGIFAFLVDRIHRSRNDVSG